MLLRLHVRRTAAVVGTIFATAAAAAIVALETAATASTAMTTTTLTAASATFEATLAAVELAGVFTGSLAAFAGSTGFTAAAAAATATTTAAVFAAILATEIATTSAVVTRTMSAIGATAFLSARGGFDRFFRCGFVLAEETFQPTEETALFWLARSGRRRGWSRSGTWLEGARLTTELAVAIVSLFSATAAITVFTAPAFAEVPAFAARFARASIATKVSAVFTTRFVGTTFERLTVADGGLFRAVFVGTILATFHAESRTIVSATLRPIFSRLILTGERAAFPTLSGTRTIFRREDIQFCFFFGQRGSGTGGSRGRRGS